jgi:hypothetical protein
MINQSFGRIGRVNMARVGSISERCVSVLYNTKMSPKRIGGCGDDSIVPIVHIPRFSLVVWGPGIRLPQNLRLAEPGRTQAKADQQHAKGYSDYTGYQTMVGCAGRPLQLKSWTSLDWAEGMVTEPCKRTVRAVHTLIGTSSYNQFILSVRATVTT